MVVTIFCLTNLSLSPATHNSSFLLLSLSLPHILLLNKIFTIGFGIQHLSLITSKQGRNAPGLLHPGAGDMAMGWGHKDIRDEDGDSRDGMGQEWGH